MHSQNPQLLEQQHYIRHKLYSDARSTIKRYAELVIGNTSFLQLLKYEAIITLLGPLPGALGLFLRQRFYPKLFKHTGKGVVFGRNLTIRNANKITLGERVVIDDDCLLDARGAGDEGVVISDEVIMNRGVSINAKVGSIHIGARTDIGAGSSIVSQGGVTVGEGIAFGGDCKIGGGLVQFDSVNTDGDGGQTHVQDTAQKTYQRITKGPIHIQTGCVFGWGVIVMDGVRVGRGCIVDAGIVIKEDIPDYTVVTMPHKLILLPRIQTVRSSRPPGKPETVVPREVESLASREPEHAAVRGPEPSAETHARITRAIFRAVDIINEQLPREKHLEKTFDTVLWGQEGRLDSLGLVNLIVAVEETIAEEFNEPITLTNDTSASEPTASFLTVGSLKDYIACLLKQVNTDSHE